MVTRASFCIMPALFAMYMPMCAPKVRPTAPPWEARMGDLWRQPVDLAERDLFYGPWGLERAPDPDATYTFVGRKQRGTNPGVVVRDPEGREWSVKQPPTANEQGAEGPIEVVLSRVLSAVGYHQPPVYFVPSFTMRDRSGTHATPGGRFRLDVPTMAKVDDWSWQQNPFVGTKPYQGLLVILLLFNSSDLKNVNNALYEVKKPDGEIERWYVVRDLGTALGETARFFPRRGNIDLFERRPFVVGVEQGFVEFDYHGWHKELIRHRITPQDVQWATALIGGLSYSQWLDAFRAGGFERSAAERFVTRVLARVDEAQRAAF